MAGLLFCTRCKAKVRANSIADGRDKLDHSIGLYLGKPCGDRSDCNGDNPLLQFREDVVSVATLKKTDKKKTKSS